MPHVPQRCGVAADRDEFRANEEICNLVRRLVADDDGDVAGVAQCRQAVRSQLFEPPAMKVSSLPLVSVGAAGDHGEFEATRSNDPGRSAVATSHAMAALGRPRPAFAAKVSWAYFSHGPGRSVARTVR